MTLPTYDIELKHLLALQAVAQHRSFGRAATSLGYTQPAVSQQIAALERIVGEPVFERPGGPKPVRLTRAGELLLLHADAVIGRMRALQADLASFQAGRLGRLAIGTFQSVSARVLPEVVARLRRDRPELEISVVESDDEVDLFALVEEGDLDVSFSATTHACSGCEVIPFVEDGFVLLSPAAEPLTQPGVPVPLARLDGLAMIEQPPTACQQRINDVLSSSRVRPQVVFRTADNATVQAMVRSGMGHAVMPWLAVDTTDPGIAFRTLEPEVPPRTIGVALSSSRRPTSALLAFIDIARQVCEQRIGAPAAAAS
jgi:DNA-binding transcriptional LysR family regulator